MKATPKFSRRQKIFLFVFAGCAVVGAAYQLASYAYKQGEIHALQWVVSHVSTASVTL